MPRIYLECSDTARSHYLTGIQRVARNVVLNHAKAARAAGVEAAPAQYFGSQFFAFDWSPANDSSKSNWGKSLKDTISSSLDQIVPARWVPQIEAVLARAKRAMRFKKIRRRFRALRFRKEISRRFRSLRLLWVNHVDHPLQPRPGDLMLLVDLTLSNRVWPAVEHWRQRGGKVAFVIYDILPITNPDLFGPKLSRSFAEWFHNVCRHADLLLAISDTVRDQLRALLEGKGDSRPQGSLRVESFRLGAELDMWHSDAYVRLPVRSAFDASSGPAPYLMVGTIEPRKNHLTVLDAFDRLWDRGSGARLVLVGRRGWKCGEIEQRLRTHPRLGKDLYWFPDLSDTELGHCYRHAKAIVFSSWGEGYGLPIVEGLQHGLPVIASDIPVHREVAGSFAAYFDPAKPEVLADCIEQLETQGVLQGVLPAREFRPVTWYEGTVDLLQRCRDFTQGLPAAN